jgi:hypothetical protein
LTAWSSCSGPRWSAASELAVASSITPHGEFAKANFAVERGVIQHLSWDVTLDVPQPKSLPTFDSIARQVYADQVALEAVPFRWLDLGPKDNVKQLTDPGKTSAAEFSKAAAAHIRWWLQQDGK